MEEQRKKKELGYGIEHSLFQQGLGRVCSCAGTRGRRRCFRQQLWAVSSWLLMEAPRTASERAQWCRYLLWFESAAAGTSAACQLRCRRCAFLSAGV